jgi:Flp pilus assembly pilin Flp
MNAALGSTQHLPVVIRPDSKQSGQGLVEYALILALVVLVVIVALLATGGQVRNLYSDIITTMCNNHVGC